MEMTIGEICRSYQEAKDPTAQIRVLADLNETSVCHIKEILRDNGFMAKRRMSKTPGGCITPEEGAIIRRIAEEGGTQIDMMAAIGHSKPTIRAYMDANGIKTGNRPRYVERQDWSEEEIKQLLKMRAQKMSFKSIAWAMNKTEGSVTNMHRRIMERMKKK